MFGKQNQLQCLYWWWDDKLYFESNKCLGKLYHHLWGEISLSLITKISVYQSVMVPTILFVSESWNPYQNHINKPALFYKNCLCSIYAEQFTDCSIALDKIQYLQSQLRRAVHIIRMSDKRIPIYFQYSQLNNCPWNVSRPLSHFKGKLKYNFKTINSLLLSLNTTPLTVIKE